MIWAAQDVNERMKTLGINSLHFKLRATGVTRTRTPGPGAQSALRALVPAGMNIGALHIHPIRQQRDEGRLL